MVPNLSSYVLTRSWSDLAVPLGLGVRCATLHTCCQVTQPAASCALPWSLHPAPSKSLRCWASPPGYLQPSRVSLKKGLPTTKRTKGRSRGEREQRVLRAPPQPIPGPPPAPAWLQSRQCPSPDSRAALAEPEGHSAGPLIVAGPAARGQAGPSPSATPHAAARGAQAQAGRGPPASRGPAPPVPGRFAWGEASTVPGPQKRPGAGRRSVSKRSWFPGLLF